MNEKFIFELKRKIAHMLSLIFIGVYLLFRNIWSHETGLLALTGILVLFLILDYFRVVKKKKIPLAHFLWREKEKEILGGNVYFTIGTLLALAVFDYHIALAGILMTLFGDAAAALVGVAIGKHKLKKVPHKSWEGVAAEFIVNIIIAAILFDGKIAITLMAATATYVETRFAHSDDNLAIPVIAGFVGQLAYIFL
jgi:phytol kinase